jgi:hypothetical protein
MTITDTYQRCQQCNTPLYRVDDWDVEMSRDTDVRQWFCDQRCRQNWFFDRWGIVVELATDERPICQTCIRPMARFGKRDAGRWRCSICRTVRRVRIQ